MTRTRQYTPPKPSEISIPTFKKGGEVKKTGLAYVHKGEKVLTKKQQTSDGYMLKHFEKDEAKGIKEYKKAETKTKGRTKETIKKILPDEKKHLKELKKLQ